RFGLNRLRGLVPDSEHANMFIRLHGGQGYRAPSLLEGGGRSRGDGKGGPVARPGGDGRAADAGHRPDLSSPSREKQTVGQTLDAGVAGGRRVAVGRVTVGRVGLAGEEETAGAGG